LGKIKGSDPAIDDVVEKAYEFIEHREWLRPFKSPHGRPWHTSFHASSFPGGVDEKRCGRKALYELMNIPGEPFSPRGRAVMEIGNAVESQIAYRLGHYGITLAGSVPINEGDPWRQLGLSDRERWLTGSIDLTLDLRWTRQGWDRVTPVDIKSKDEKKIREMRMGMRGPDQSHIGQVMSYSHLCRVWHSEMGWEQMGLRPAEGGILYYSNRASPRDTYEFWVPWDQEYVDAGLRRLEQWRDSFTEMKLPPRDKKWRWTEEPCKWCDFKKACKADVKADVQDLSQSCTVTIARSKNPGYDPQEAVREVVGAWE
jgi:hypothetical protein